MKPFIRGIGQITFVQRKRRNYIFLISLVGSHDIFLSFIVRGNKPISNANMYNVSVFLTK